VVLAVAAVLILWFGRNWNARTKYDAAPVGSTPDGGALDGVDSWDSLSRGEDPTL